MVRAFARMNGVIYNFCQKHSPTRGQNDYIEGWRHQAEGRSKGML